MSLLQLLKGAESAMLKAVLLEQGRVKAFDLGVLLLYLGTACEPALRREGGRWF